MVADLPEKILNYFSVHKIKYEIREDGDIEVNNGLGIIYLQKVTLYKNGMPDSHYYATLYFKSPEDSFSYASVLKHAEARKKLDNREFAAIIRSEEDFKKIEEFLKTSSDYEKFYETAEGKLPERRGRIF